jgi:tRNA dimethylallyltransferase
MAEGGALEEAALLDARNLDPSLPVMKAIGVPQFIAAARGALPVDSAIAEAAQATRNYAKRQYTWFRHQPPTDWPRAQPQNVNLTSVFERLFS